MGILNIDAAPPSATVHGPAERATPGSKRTDAPRPERTPPREEAPPPPPAERPAPPPTPAAKRIDLPEFRHYELSFKLNEERGRVVVQVIDSKTGTVVRTVPPDELLNALREVPDPRGVLLDREG
jgi:hypothetical protein